MLSSRAPRAPTAGKHTRGGEGGTRSEPRTRRDLLTRRVISILFYRRANDFSRAPSRGHRDRQWAPSASGVARYHGALCSCNSPRVYFMDFGSRFWGGGGGRLLAYALVLVHHVSHFVRIYTSVVCNRKVDTLKSIKSR